MRMTRVGLLALSEPNVIIPFATALKQHAPLSQALLAAAPAAGLAACIMGPLLLQMVLTTHILLQAIIVSVRFGPAI